MDKDEYIKILEDALTDLTDGENEVSIQMQTGLPYSRCMEIMELSNEIFRKRG